ncbi:MAG: aminotransferase class I/II-fold pyridoxal phosphate-dependent enzyme [candidate division Zixibacteria bacterium]|nr:aminotransferase class I/II-fold pyridoxal phosphate-dependent enzyme [candidate division Zixibacteria bacterium]
MPVKKVLVDKADRLHQLPPDLLSFIPGLARSIRIKKTSTLDLATFQWPVPFETTSSLSADDLRPADESSLNDLREALAGWYSTYHGVRLNPSREIILGPGISGLLWQLALAFVDHGDIVFVPELGLPTYRRLATACGGQPVHYGISARNHWLPDFDRINSRLGRVARLLFLNTPHNPTGAELTEKELSDLIWIASRENLAIVNDTAYSTLSGRKPTSLLAVRGGKKVGVEVGSFAYTFGLPAIPLGFAVGNREMIAGLEQSRKLLPLSIPKYCVDMALAAVRKFPSEDLLQLRNNLTVANAEVVSLLGSLGLDKAGFETVPFVWAQIKRRRQSSSAAAQLFRRFRIQTVPGIAFGNAGEGFLRFSTTAPIDDYRLAQERVRRKQHLLRRDRKK